MQWLDTSGLPGKLQSSDASLCDVMVVVHLTVGYPFVKSAAH